MKKRRLLLVLSSCCSVLACGDEGGNDGQATDPIQQTPGPSDSAPPSQTPTTQTPTTQMPTATTAPMPSETAAPTPARPEYLPADESMDTIGTFLSQGLYEGDGWTAQTSAPREQSMVVSPHGRVRVHLTNTLVESIAAGNGGLGSESGQAHTFGSMAVKELYDDDDMLVGIAALLRQTDSDGWITYCYGPIERCATGMGPFTQDDPYFDLDSNTLTCRGCHAGNIFTTLDE